MAQLGDKHFMKSSGWTSMGNTGKAENMKKAELQRSPRPNLLRRIPVTVKCDGARTVLITGDFNRWAAEGVRLSHNGNGTWHTELELAPGEYQYRLLVDGQWRDHLEASKKVPNPFGSNNCVLVVE
jgi:hypothetical protein